MGEKKHLFHKVTACFCDILAQQIVPALRLCFTASHTDSHMESGISLAVAGKAADASPHTDRCGCTSTALGESQLLPFFPVSCIAELQFSSFL